jgi:hypothetical protein
MRFIRVKSAFILTIFTSAILNAEEPSLETPKPPQVNIEEVHSDNTRPSVQALESVPMVKSKKDVDHMTDIFLRGGFCVITAVLFLAGFLAVKSNGGSRVHSAE